MNQFFHQLPQPFFALAPMDDVTDTVFRQIIASCAKPDLFFTEFVNVDGLQSPGRLKLLHKLQFTEIERPIIAQIWGKIPDNFFKTAQELVTMGFAGVDINMGCPDKKVIKNGCCSALINDRQLASEIIIATQAGVADKIPVSVKMRTGFDKVDFSWPAFLLEHKLDLLTVHGRTTLEMSKPPSRWVDIATIRQLRDKIAPDTLIVGNGDVTSRQQGELLAKQYQLDGIMIGRGIFGDPYIFANRSVWPNLTKTQKLTIYSQHIRLFMKTWPNQQKNPQLLKKFAKVYANDFVNAAEIRNQLVQQSTIDEMLAVIKALI